MNVRNENVMYVVLPPILGLLFTMDQQCVKKRDDERNGIESEKVIRHSFFFVYVLLALLAFVHHYGDEMIYILI